MDILYGQQDIDLLKAPLKAFFETLEKPFGFFMTWGDERF
jgi:hypothetical protein